MVGMRATPNLALVSPVPARQDFQDVSRIPAARAPRSSRDGASVGNRAPGRRAKGRQVILDRLPGYAGTFGRRR